MVKSCDIYDDIQKVIIGPNHLFGITHTGLCRMANEDRFVINGLPDGSVIFAVADGLGVTSTGAHAAERIRQKLSAITAISTHDELSELNRIAKEADRAIYTESLRNPYLDGMGSTLVGVLIRENTAYWVHVGDSRLYYLRSGILNPVTEDQTLARFLLNENQITPAQSQTHYSRFVMDQYLGCGYAEPETGKLKILDDDLLVLATDGLHNQISNDSINSILNASDDLAAKGKALVKAALNAGGADNITVVMAKR